MQPARLSGTLGNMPDHRSRWLLAALLTLAASAFAEGPGAPAAGAEARLRFHLARAATLRETLAPFVYGPCPEFPSRTAWESHLAGRVAQGVTFAAHLDEAWREAKASGDRELQARVKAVKRGMLVGNPVQLVGKLTSCAWKNGASLDPWGLWKRATEEVRRRRVELAREAERAASRQ
ncbi:MAG: hypothetical protein ACREMB_26305 [Candidatus Rokuibacteriota bacterium]